MDEFLGRRVNTEILAVKGKNGWTVTQKIIQARTKDLENWEKQQISAQVVSETAEKAASETTFQLMAYLESVDGDLFNKSELLVEPEKEDLQ